jgi:hypothetical protein
MDQRPVRSRGCGIGAPHWIEAGEPVSLSSERSPRPKGRRGRLVERSVASVVVALALFATVAGSPADATAAAGSIPGSAGVAAPAPAPVDPGLETEAATGAAVPVIVQLAGVADATNDDPARQPAKRAQIDRSTARVLDALPGGSSRTSTPIGDLPMVAMVVDHEGLASLAANPAVARVSRNKPNRPLATNTTNITNIGAPAAWGQGFTGSGQTVAVVDSGVATSHSFLAGKVVAEGCFSTNIPANIPGAAFSAANCPGPDPTTAIGPGTGQPCPLDVAECEHGTHVAGIAVGGAGGSFSGVAPGAALISVNVFSSYNADPLRPNGLCGGVAKCAVAWDSDIIRGLLYVDSLRSTRSIAAVNLSLGSGSATANACDSDPIAPAINQLTNHGIAVVVAAGNNYSKTGISSPSP